MKERPILFSGPMVRAILEGRKTQTRRVVKPQPPSEYPFAQDATTGGVTAFWWTDRDIDSDELKWWPGYDEEKAMRCPYGSPGDRLWVKETHRFDGLDPRIAINDRRLDQISYRADMIGDRCCDSCAWRPSIFMPRWASRITLEIASVRVERLTQISDFDAFKEGSKTEAGTITGPYCMSFKQGFKSIWESINGPGSWDSNPWVWVIEFRRVEK